MHHHSGAVMIYGILTSSLTHAFQTSISHHYQYHPPAFRLTTHLLHQTITTTATKPSQSFTTHRTISSSLPAKHKHNNASSPSSILTQSRTKCFRPTISDVNRISYGKPAKVKGTGSRGVPHRLNADERETYDRSRKRGYLEVIGSSYRRERRGSPLLNTWRNWCDAKGRVCVVLHKSVAAGGGGGGGVGDEVVVDLSPMRLPGEFGRVEEVVRRSVVEDAGVVACVFVGVGEEDVENDVMSTDEKDDVDIDNDDAIEDKKEDDDEDDAWNDRPIHQLPPYSISWAVPNRSEAKTLCKHLATIFDTKDGQGTTKSRKPRGVKPGKNRRSGGYGIG